MKFKRVFLIICDSLGVGEALDASNYGDIGANTLGHIIDKNELFIPNLSKLGFLNTINCSINDDATSYYTMARPKNKGKDSLSGHYELMGIRNEYSFPSFYENGFPDELIKLIEVETGRRVIGNIGIDNSLVLKEFGEEQIRTNGIIIYASKGSSLKISAHESIISLDELYDICEKVRDITNNNEKWRVSRVIARPFAGNNKTNFYLTPNRRDFVVNPPMKSVLDKLEKKGYSVISIGKVYDLFNGNGITKRIVSKNNKEGIDKILDILDKKFTGLCVLNLNDFDLLYGHKRDYKGYAEAIEALDVEIPMILNKLGNEDLLIITADHGNDPTFSGSSHTRENIPVIMYSRKFKNQGLLPIMETYADVGATIADNFEVDMPMIGKSYLDILE